MKLRTLAELRNLMPFLHISYWKRENNHPPPRPEILYRQIREIKLLYISWDFVLLSVVRVEKIVSVRNKEKQFE